MFEDNPQRAARIRVQQSRTMGGVLGRWLVCRTFAISSGRLPTDPWMDPAPRCARRAGRVSEWNTLSCDGGLVGRCRAQAGEIEPVAFRRSPARTTSPSAPGSARRGRSHRAGRAGRIRSRRATRRGRRRRAGGVVCACLRLQHVDGSARKDVVGVEQRVVVAVGDLLTAALGQVVVVAGRGEAAKRHRVAAEVRRAVVAELVQHQYQVAVGVAQQAAHCFRAGLRPGSDRRRTVRARPPGRAACTLQAGAYALAARLVVVPHHAQAGALQDVSSRDSLPRIASSS
jgi:hypothetical protein